VVWRPWSEAVTRTVTSDPTSPVRTVYDVPVAPARASPPAYHRRWSRAVAGRQRPGSAVSTLPTVGVPVIAGTDLGTGPRPQV
jgi:hypothetical protein